ncbi:uncharacterized protein LOC133387065 isoform X3 [Rhineura floridana]|uniref:uncharacterized protein LOC133387065 isoform X3 n=1 Tax=Rhineura floridana TaxID=261503 RepID=UPI002AC86E85|nr:uncharacterized protein LOC133387065 isoform X3 [Rhineura floridana]
MGQEREGREDFCKQNGFAAGRWAAGRSPAPGRGLLLLLKSRTSRPSPATLVLSFAGLSCEAVDVLNHCLAATMDWMRANKLRLNPDKTEMLLVDGFSDRMVDTYPILDGVTLPLKDRVRSLGVVLDSSLSLEAQVASVARNAFYQLRLVAQLCPYLSKEDLTSVVHALITLRLDYCNALYVGLPLKTVRKLQLVQNAAARLLTGTKRSDHITPVLARLHWLPICFRARF